MVRGPSYIELRMNTQQLAALIGQKHEVLVQLRQLSSQQANFVGAGDTNSLLVVLSAKQTLLNRLKTIEHQLGPFRHQDPDSRSWPSPADRQQCAEMVRQCETLLAETVKVERESEAEMQRQRDVAAARLQETGSAAEARKAYTLPSEPANQRSDLFSKSI